MDHRSRADQELFLPGDNQSQGQAHQQPEQGQSRFYEGLNNNSAAASDVPAINVIDATPSTSRSSTVRSNVRSNVPHYSHPPEMSGGVTGVIEEEDDLYDAPRPNAADSEAPPIPQKSPARSSFGSNAAEAAPQHQPATGATYMPGHDAGYESAYASVAPHSDFEAAQAPSHSDPQPAHAPPQQPTEIPPHPPSYEEWRAGHDLEQPPPLPGPRPPVPTTDLPEDHSSNIHPSVHLDTDQDYAYALQLQEEEENRAPPLPQRPRPEAPEVDRNIGLASHQMTAEEQDHALALRLQEEEDNVAPSLPIRPGQQARSGLAPNEPPAFTRTPSTEQFLPPPRRTATDFGTDNPSDPVHYTRDPHKLIAYLVQFPTPTLQKAPSDAIPKRFLIYTPPPPPLQAPPEGVKETKSHKIQRKWQNEVRQAKLSEAKTTSWPGFKAKVTRGVSKAMTYTTNSNIDFLSRVQPGEAPTTSTSRSPSPPIDRKDGTFTTDATPEDPAHQSHETKKTVGIDEMIFVYSPSMNLTPPQMREEFVNTVMRTKSKAMRDSVIATGLLPISLAVDIILIAVSGIFEVNAAWAYFNIKGAKTARSVGKRLSSSTTTTSTATTATQVLQDPSVGVGFGGVDPEKPNYPQPTTTSEIDPSKPDAEMAKEDKLQLSFRPAARIDILSRYLHAECHKVDPKLFPEFRVAAPTESYVSPFLPFSFSSSTTLALPTSCSQPHLFPHDPS